MAANAVAPALRWRSRSRSWARSSTPSARRPASRRPGAAGLPLLLRRSDEHFVDRHVVGLLDRVDDRARDVAGLEHLADLLLVLLHRLHDQRVLVVALQLGVDEAGLDDRD